MTDQETETPLRKALDATDSVRRRVLTGALVAAVVAVGAYLNMWHVQHTTTDVKQVVIASVTALTSLIAWAALAVILTVVRMTKKILRAIDVTNRAAAR